MTTADARERPILIGRPEVIEARCERFGITARAGKDFELVNPENDDDRKRVGLASGNWGHSGSNFEVEIPKWIDKKRSI